MSGAGPGHVDASGAAALGSVRDAPALDRLAALAGIRRHFRDQLGVDRTSPDDAVLATLAALGHDVDGPGGVEGALEAGRIAAHRPTTEAVAVAWLGEPSRVTVRVPAAIARATAAADPAAAWRLHDLAPLADPELDRDAAPRVRPWMGPVAPAEEDGRPPATPGVDEPAVPIVLELRPADGPGPGDGPHPWSGAIGAWRGTLMPAADVVGAAAARAATIRLDLLVAPPRVPRPPRPWLGLFAPVHALHDGVDPPPGPGHAGHLRRLADWAARSGVDLVATLPPFWRFVDGGPGEPFEPSPYAPASRLAWDETLIDPALVAERLGAGAPALPGGSSVGGPPAGAEADVRGRFVDWRREADRTRPWRQAIGDAVGRRERLRAARDAWLAAHPDVAAGVDRVADRASHDASGPEAARRRDAAFRRHAAAQWLAAESLAAAAAGPAARGGGIGVDVPVGVHPDGPDAARFPGAFLTGVAAGAPPDALFTGGQDWGFAPMHPGGAAADGADLMRRTFAHAAAAGRLVRIDHVMGLNRIYCIPAGTPATQGHYLRQPAEPLAAAVAIAAHRRGCTVVGEDLGTVPPETEAMLERHELLGMRVAQFELPREEHHALPASPPRTIASVNTHDTPTFAGHWAGRDSAILLAANVVDAAERADRDAGRAAELAGLRASLARAGRLGAGADNRSGEGAGAAGAAELAELLDGLLAHLAAGRADVVMVALEDLWLETEPQNVPGVTHAFPAWTRIAARGLDAIRAGDAAERLARLAEIRAASGTDAD